MSVQHRLAPLTVAEDILQSIDNRDDCITKGRSVIVSVSPLPSVFTRHVLSSSSVAMVAMSSFHTMG